MEGEHFKIQMRREGTCLGDLRKRDLVLLLVLCLVCKLIAEEKSV